jgi:hypothetical protein
MASHPPDNKEGKGRKTAIAFARIDQKPFSRDGGKISGRRETVSFPHFIFREGLLRQKRMAKVTF